MTIFAELTPNKRLRTGRSVWSDTRHPQITLDAITSSRELLLCDIAIVGAGISGAFMAHALSQRYDKVIVLDRRSPAMGSTHASTAMLQFEIDTPLTVLSEKIGHARAARAWRRSWLATQSLIRLVENEKIACALEKRCALYLCGPEMGFRAMDKEADARRRAGLACEFLSAASLRARYGIDRTGAIHSRGAAVADPVALTRGLLKKARASGARIYAPAEVHDVFATKHGVVLDVGARFIVARKVVFCTGYEIPKHVPAYGLKITSSWAAATAPNSDFPGWLNDTLVWEAAQPYLYMRTGAGGRLIVGGEDADLDSPSYRADALETKAKMLARKTAALLPDINPHWTHIWAGAFGESSDGLPIIDAVPDLPNCFAILGFGGNGTIYSQIAAQMMPALLEGRSHPDRDIFGFRS
jgi:glycine/D-amino acid oxidase-like deaminating enzyme